MTTIATVVGLVPMALGIGEGSETNLPLARAVIGGLTVSTFFTLFLVPALYTLLDRFAKRTTFDDEDAPPAAESSACVRRRIQRERAAPSRQERQGFFGFWSWRTLAPWRFLGTCSFGDRRGGQWAIGCAEPRESNVCSGHSARAGAEHQYGRGGRKKFSTPKLGFARHAQRRFRPLAAIGIYTRLDSER